MAAAPNAPRRIALIIWGAILAGVAILVLVAALVGPSLHRDGDPAGLAEVLVPLAAVLAAGTLVASRLVPRLVQATGDQGALAKHVTACALCDGGALFAAVVWMVTGAPLALALLLLPLAGLLACWPGDARWAALGGVVAAPPPPRGFGPPGPGAGPGPG